MELMFLIGHESYVNNPPPIVQINHSFVNGFLTSMTTNFNHRSYLHSDYLIICSTVAFEATPISAAEVIINT
jgi:hypothetical protein